VIKDLRPISTVALTPMILAVPADSPAKNLKEFLVLAKQRDWNFGSVGNGSLSHLTGEYFNHLAGLRLTHIPYSGGAPMMTAFGGGQIQAAFVTGIDGAAMVRAGRVKYLAVATAKKTAVAPGLPAIAEEIPGFSSVAWFGLLAPRRVPDAVVTKIQAAVQYAVARNEVQQMFAERQLEARSSTPAELEKLIRDETTQWEAVVRRSNIRMD
jgi:tripartite-type tricarboxylate transporter receptor subunit TctC